MSTRDWLIWSNEHGQWWAPRRDGYVKRLEDAGLYTRDEANEILRQTSVDGRVRLNDGGHKEVAILALTLRCVERQAPVSNLSIGRGDIKATFGAPL